MSASTNDGTVHDVVIVGDGPAGSAVAAATSSRGVDAVLVGSDRPWSATYASWIDDLDSIPVLNGNDIWLHRLGSIAVDLGARRTIDRAYGVIDNDALRGGLRQGVEHRIADVESIHVDPIEGVDDLVVRTADGRSLRARVVIDATGWPGWSRRGRPGSELADVPRQTAIGVVFESPPDGPLGSPTLMDFSRPDAPDDDVDVPSFAYAVPVPDGWLVEETVLAATPAIAPQRLLARLAARLATSSEQLVAAATRIEHVDIPMGGPLPDRTSEIIAFGAAAGMIHPATGYSIAAALSGVDPLADAIVDVVGRPTADRRELWDTVWPRSAQRTRALHDFGLDVLLDLDAEAIRLFFDVFFDLPSEEWSNYLKISTPPTEVARSMARMFGAAPWPLRRRLVSRNPTSLAQLLRP